MLVEKHREPEAALRMNATEVDQGLRARDFAMIEHAMAAIEAVSDPANASDMAQLPG